MRIKPFKALKPDLDRIVSNDTFFATVKEDYPLYRKKDLFHISSEEALYLYQIKTHQRSFTGLITCSALDDYLNGKIKLHEHTLADRRQKQIDLLHKRKAAVKPILLTYPPVNLITMWLAKYIRMHSPSRSVRFPDEQQEHRFWKITSPPDIQALVSLFEKHIPQAYIADGHHRLSASVEHYHATQRKKFPADQLLCAYFDTSQLEVHEFNRIVEVPKKIKSKQWLDKLSDVFNIAPLQKPCRPGDEHEMSLLLNKSWYKLRWKENILDSYAQEKVILDAHLLNEWVLYDIFGIEDVRTDARIDYVEGPKGLDGLAKKTEKNNSYIGFALYPMNIEDVLRIADEGQVLPPKSTWFEPRIKNGLIVMEY